MHTKAHTVSTRTRLGAIVLAYVCTLALLAVLAAPVAYGQEEPTAEEQRLQLLDGEVRSIAERIGQVENNINQVEAQRRESEKSIAALGAESQALLPGLQAKSTEFKRKQAALKEAVNIDYKDTPSGAVELLAQSDSISETLAKASYQDRVTEKVDNVAQEAEKAKDELADYKQQVDGKRSSQEVLRRQLILLQQSVVQQKAELTELQANRGNEAVYLRERIARAKQAQAALLNSTTGPAIWGTFSDGAVVRRGDIIGFEGSTGNSTGCHTHFSVISDGKWVDPAGQYQRIEKPAGVLTQPFGMTAYARSGAYGGDIHNGIDVAQGCGKPVRAAADGTIIRDNRTDRSGYGHYIMIRHTDGLISLYAHML